MKKSYYVSPYFHALPENYEHDPVIRQLWQDVQFLQAEVKELRARLEPEPLFEQLLPVFRERGQERARMAIIWIGLFWLIALGGIILAVYLSAS